MLERLKSEGPGLPTIVLEEGVALMEKFQTELKSKLATRENLLEAERLFDLTAPPTPISSRWRRSSGSSRRCMPSTSPQTRRSTSHGPTLFAELDPKKLHAFSKEFIEKVEETKETRAGEETGVRAGGGVYPGVQELPAAHGGAQVRRVATAALGATVRITRQSPRISTWTPRRSLSALCSAWSCTGSTSP